MNIDEEHNPMTEHRTQFAFKGKREHISKINMPNITYPNQHIDTEIPHGSRDHVIVPDTIKITFNIDINRQNMQYCEQCRQGTGKKKGAHASFKEN